MASQPHARLFGKFDIEFATAMPVSQSRSTNGTYRGDGCPAFSLAGQFKRPIRQCAMWLGKDG
jgi:hypothetical protein